MSAEPKKCGHPPIMGYGFFPGGDPRRFSPDSENRPEELAAHAAACALWDRGMPSDEWHSGRIVDFPGGAAIVCGHRFGVGGYEIDCDCKGEEGTDV